MAQKYYAVRKGKKPGIYRTWPETQKQVSGFSGAEYKSFATAAEAETFMQSGSAKASKRHATASKAATAKRPSATVSATITVYTDGGSRNTGNVAGGHVRDADKAAWAYRIELPDTIETGSAGEFGATNNRMEIMAFRNALQKLVDLGQNHESILFVLDSQYVLNAVNKGWLAGWKRRGWKRSAGPLVNAELWQDVDRLLPQFNQLDYQWTKGHATNQGNVFVDHLLNETMDGMSRAGKGATTTHRTQPATKATTTKATTKTQPTAQAQPATKIARTTKTAVTAQPAVKSQPVIKPATKRPTTSAQKHQTAEQSVADIAESLRHLPFEDD
ncbi:ribonuclease H family protein [Levilactobacillus cerevisiae]|uniref:ribonuclease H family protein n=1 Tax=Levilactobacillus cerevisiae TaxID=1704076 RepID=UPI000F79D32E|nr:ribonuclease H family protein [Levilactobacillus cerevisiae]